MGNRGGGGQDAERRIIVIGAGPTGLGCGRELDSLGHRNWTLIERADHAGGLASTVVDPAGFTWDLGGHVVFSHYGEFDRLLEETMGDELVHHERASYVRYQDRWVPYPFQNNLRYLPPEAAFECLLGLIEAPGAATADGSFENWMTSTFGAGIVEHFMRPYNFKVWATPADRMSAGWIAERVSVVDFRRALRNHMLGLDDAGWGPNNLFSFPALGGTGEIYARAAAKLGDRIQYGRELIGIDAEARVARFADGRVENYAELVSTMPLDLLVGLIDSTPDSLRRAAAQLRRSSVYMVGVGFATPLADEKCWMYYPDDRAPFYRATNFARYAAANVPGADVESYSSYMTETAYSPEKPEDRATIEERVIAGLRSTGTIAEAAEVASVHVEDINYAYPVPTLGRDAALAEIQPWLMNKGIRSRGRFGSWRYEIGNMDHSVRMGVDAARSIVRGDDEVVWAGAG